MKTAILSGKGISIDNRSDSNKRVDINNNSTRKSTGTVVALVIEFAQVGIVVKVVAATIRCDTFMVIQLMSFVRESMTVL